MKHLEQVGMTYIQHMLRALCISFKLFSASFALVVHAFIPFLFETYASSTISEIHSSLKK